MVISETLHERDGEHTTGGEIGINMTLRQMGPFLDCYKQLQEKGHMNMNQVIVWNSGIFVVGSTSGG